MFCTALTTISFKINTTKTDAQRTPKIGLPYDIYKLDLYISDAP